MAERTFAVIEALALALWIGALAGFAFVFAPTAFAVVTNLDRFAELIATTVTHLNALGYWCGGIALVAIVLRNREDAALGRSTAIRAIAVLVMLALVFVEGHFIVPAMADAQRAFGGSFAAVPNLDPRRVRYDDLHRISSVCYGLVLLLGSVTLAFGVVTRPAAVLRR